MPRTRPRRDGHVHRLLTRAQAARDQGLPDRAEALLRAGLGRRPDHPLIPMELGLLLEELGRHEEAEAYLTSAARHGDVVCLVNLAGVLARHDRHAEAVVHLEQARSALRSELAEGDGEGDEPKRWLLAVIEVALARSLRSLGRVRQAAALFGAWADHPELGVEVRRGRGEVDGDEGEG